MSKQEITNLVNNYLKIFPNEDKYQEKLINFIKETNEQDLIDWNNFNGHLVSSAFIYAKKEKKFLVLYHKDLEMYLYPGGHIEKEDESIIEAAKREIKEETGITDFKIVLINNQILPIDINTHIIDYNKRLKLSSHTHYDFRYLFTIEQIEVIKTDTNEIKDFKWIDINKLEKDKHFGNLANKFRKILGEE